MSKAKRGLGKGLDALLTTDPVIVSAPLTTQPTEINCDDVQPGHYQPRGEIDPQGLTELIDSIRVQGVLQPILVRALKTTEKPHYEIIAGERRWRAATAAGLKSIPVMIKDLSDQQALEIGVIENIQREDLNPLEKAKALQQLIDEFKLTQQQVAERLGWSRSTVTNILRLNGLTQEVKHHLVEGQIELGHAKVLLSLTPLLQSQAAEIVVNKQLSVRETEQLAQRLKNPPTKNSTRSSVSDHIAELQHRLAGTLNTKVKINQNESGKGTVVLHFDNEKTLTGIIERVVGWVKES